MDVKIPCPCPPKADGEPRHERDTITFRDRLDFHGGLVVRKALTMLKQEDPDAGAAEVLASMAEYYVLEGVSDWSLVDEKGKRVECTKSALRAFIAEHEDIVIDDLVDAADALYQEQVLLPLLKRALTSSPESPTSDSTSATPESSTSTSRNQKRSSRSSTSTTRTAGTATITSLPGGDSKSSRSSATAA